MQADNYLSDKYSRAMQLFASVMCMIVFIIIITQYFSMEEPWSLMVWPDARILHYSYGNKLYSSLDMYICKCIL